MDSNHRRRKPAELQSAPFGHSGNCPEGESQLSYSQPHLATLVTAPLFLIAVQRYDLF